MIDSHACVFCQQIIEVEVDKHRADGPNGPEIQNLGSVHVCMFCGAVQCSDKRTMLFRRITKEEWQYLNTHYTDAIDMLRQWHDEAVKFLVG